MEAYPSDLSDVKIMILITTLILILKRIWNIFYFILLFWYSSNLFDVLIRFGMNTNKVWCDVHSDPLLNILIIFIMGLKLWNKQKKLIGIYRYSNLQSKIFKNIYF